MNLSVRWWPFRAAFLPFSIHRNLSPCLFFSLLPLCFASIGPVAHWASLLKQSDIDTAVPWCSLSLMAWPVLWTGHTQIQAPCAQSFRHTLVDSISSSSGRHHPLGSFYKNCHNEGLGYMWYWQYCKGGYPENILLVLQAVLWRWQCISLQKGYRLYLYDKTSLAMSAGPSWQQQVLQTAAGFSASCWVLVLPQWFKCGWVRSGRGLLLLAPLMVYLSKFPCKITVYNRSIDVLFFSPSVH